MENRRPPCITQIGVELENIVKVKVNFGNVPFQASNVIPNPDNRIPREIVRWFTLKLVNTTNDFEPQG